MYCLHQTTNYYPTRRVSDPYKAIFYCVVDESGKQIFDSPEQVEQNVDLIVQLKLNAEIGNVFAKSFNVEDVEAK